MIARPDAFRAAQKVYTKALQEHPQSGVYREIGTAAMGNFANNLAALPTRGFSSGKYEDVEKISGEQMVEQIKQRGGTGRPTHACMRAV